MGAEWECERCGKTVDRKDNHVCDPADIAEYLAAESGEHDAETDDRLERIERRQRILAGALLVSLGLDAADDGATARGGLSTLGLYLDSPFADDLSKAAVGALREEWGDELSDGRAYAARGRER